jgi:transcriptional regulator with XRE-family HTH domain/sRNA-binding regulator protein Hfq
MALDLWQLRRQKRMTIDELARTAGVHPALIKAYELGERAIPERDLERLASALEVEIEDIKELSDPPPRGPSRPAAPSPLEGDAPRPRYDSSPRYDSGSRYDSGPRYDSGSRYDSGRPSYGRSDSNRSGYGGSEGRPSYGGGEAGRSGYGGGEAGRSGYGGSEGRSGYSSPNYNRGYGDRPAPRYDSDRGPARPPRPPYRPDRPDQPDRMERRPERPLRKPGGLKRRPQVAPARPSQLEHLKILLQQLDMSGDDLLRLAGKPLSMLNRKEASHLLTTCQEMLAERKPERPKGKRQRPYLPESVDEHELVYLTQVQLDESPMQLTLFNGTTLEGTLQGFSPYALTLATNGGDEVTVQKLAIAFYQVRPSPADEVAEQDGES